MIESLLLNSNFLTSIEFASPEEVYNELSNLWKPPPDLTLTQWAEAYRELSRENCALPGKYRVAVTPFLQSIQEAYTDPSIKKIVCQKSAQVAWTDGVINNIIGFQIDLDPCAMIVLFPTESMAERYSKEKFAPMVRDTDVLTHKLSAKSRDASNTLLSKHFLGGHLELVGSNAPSGLASSPIRIIIVEEPDRCSRNAGNEGNSLKLVYERGKTFHNRKIILGGSPTWKGVSEIEREMALSDKRYFKIPCPKCNAFFDLKWSMVKWEKADKDIHEVFKNHLPETAKIECPKCKLLFDNAAKNEMLLKGRWEATAPFTDTAGFYINELYSPFPNARLQDVVEKFLEAKKFLDSGDHTLMVTWTNTSMGETYEIQGTSVDSSGFENRREIYHADVPHDGIIITCWFDVQDDRFEGEWVAWGPDEESWSLDYVRLYGEMTQPQIWKELRRQMNRDFVSPSGTIHRARLCGIDSGGHFNSEVHNFCKQDPFRYIPTFGASASNKPIAGFPRSKNQKTKTYLTEVGTDTAKQVIYARLALQEFGAGYSHFPLLPIYDDKYFNGLTIERMVKKYAKGNEYYAFEAPSGARNEPLDCRVGNFVMIRILQQNQGINLNALRKVMNKSLEVIAGIKDGTQTVVEVKPKAKPKKAKSFGKAGTMS